MGKGRIKKLNKKTIYQILAVCFWLLVWEASSRAIGKEILLVSPVKVLFIIFRLVKDADFWQTIAFSSLRILSGFLLALFTGIITAALSYKNRLFHELISPLMKVIKVTPVVSFVLLAIIWINTRNLSILISFLMVVPVVFSNVLQGLKNTDEKLLQFAGVFRLGRYKRVKAIYIPAIRPYLISAISVGLGFGFKAGIAAEVIGFPAKSIGEKLYEAKLYLMTGDLLAWTVIIVLISIFFEKGLMQLFRKEAA